MPCSDMNPIPVPTALERQGANLFHTGLSARPRPARTTGCNVISRLEVHRLRRRPAPA